MSSTSRMETCFNWSNMFNTELSLSLKRYWALAGHHDQNDPCITIMGNGESHFNVSLIVRGKVTKTVSINHNF